MSVVQPVIDVKNLTFIRDADILLEDFSFSIEPGEYVAIIGPNGGGKTTLLNMLLGLIPPTSGTILLFGQPNTEPAALRRVGFIPQRGGLIEQTFPATVREVVSAGRTQRLGLFRSFAKEDDQAVEAALEMLGILSLQNRVISGLSGGERQRVLLARALASNPDLLILDEPVDGLDPMSREEFYATLRRINKAGTAILFVTHDVHRISNEADSAICLRHELVCHGTKSCVISGRELRNMRHASTKELMEHHGA